MLLENLIILLNIDFPRRKKNTPPKEEMIKREKLAEKYNKKGSFPLVIIINHNGDILAETGYKKITVNEYIRHIKVLIQDFYSNNDMPNQKLDLYKKRDVLMGSNFEIAAIHHEKESALNIIDIKYPQSKGFVVQDFSESIID